MDVCIFEIVKLSHRLTQYHKKWHVDLFLYTEGYYAINKRNKCHGD